MGIKRAVNCLKIIKNTEQVGRRAALRHSGLTSEFVYVSSGLLWCRVTANVNISVSNISTAFSSSKTSSGPDSCGVELLLMLTLASQTFLRCFSSSNVKWSHKMESVWHKCVICKHEDMQRPCHSKNISNKQIYQKNIVILINWLNDQSYHYL